VVVYQLFGNLPYCITNGCYPSFFDIEVDNLCDLKKASKKNLASGYYKKEITGQHM
jgi:hypothetical protein